MYILASYSNCEYIYFLLRTYITNDGSILDIYNLILLKLTKSDIIFKITIISWLGGK